MVIDGGMGQCQLDRHGPGGASRSQDHGVQSLDPMDAGQRLEKPLAVGVVADQLAVPVDHAVDRADDLGGRVQPIEVGDDGDLVGDRAVEALPVHGARSAHGLAQVFGPDLDGQVSPVQAHLGECGLDHRLGGILGDGVSEDSDKLLFEVGSASHGWCSSIADERSRDRRCRERSILILPRVEPERTKPDGIGRDAIVADTTNVPLSRPRPLRPGVEMAVNADRDPGLLEPRQAPGPGRPYESNGG